MTSGRKRWVARILDNDTVRKIAPQNWVLWRQTTDAYRGIGYKAGKLPPESGDLLVHQPYGDWFNLVWGLAPNADMPKWRWMYRSRPEIRRGIDAKVIYAVGRGFQVVCEDDDEVEQYANRLMKFLHVDERLPTAVTDMLVYGQGYLEKVRIANGDTQEGENLAPAKSAASALEATAQVTRLWNTNLFSFDQSDLALNAYTQVIKDWTADTEKVDRWLAQSSTQAVAPLQRESTKPAADADRLRTSKFGSEVGDLVDLKPLDPLWMRMNRDAFNNQLGFVQWGLTPIPQSIVSDKIVYLRWMPKSWAHENAYGTSVLMPIQRHMSLLIQAEEDMKVWWHQYAKPMLVVKGGTPEKPYPVPTLTTLRSKFQERQPNTDVIIPGDCDVQVMQAGTRDTTATFAQYTGYLVGKIYESLGVYDVLMGSLDSGGGGGNRSNSDTKFQAFVAEERMIQDTVAAQLLPQLILPELERVYPEKFKGAKPLTVTIVWPPILEEDLNKRMDRLVKGTGKPFITVNEARVEAGKKPLDKPEYDELPEAPMIGAFNQPSKPEQSESQRTGAREEGLQQRDKGTDS